MRKLKEKITYPTAFDLAPIVKVQNKKRQVRQINKTMNVCFFLSLKFKKKAV